jgi:DNA-binding GntR family transcriptional regulator
MRSDISDHKSKDERASALAQISAVQTISAEEEVYRRLRAAIVTDLPPGTRLSLSELAHQLGVSTMPIRGALVRLEAEGFVTQKPRKSAVVSAMSLDDFLDLYAIRQALEATAARIGCQGLDKDSCFAMRRILEQMRNRYEEPRADVNEYLRLDWQLHDICYQAAKRRRLLKAIRDYRGQSERYFRIYLSGIDGTPMMPQDLSNQEQFVRACEERDAEAAVQAITRLFGSTSAHLRPLLERLDVEVATPANSQTSPVSP